MSKSVIPDISHYETVKEWRKVAESAPFLIMKATEGTDYVDPTLGMVVTGCRSMNLPYWLFVYLKKGSEDYHVSQVDFFMKTLIDRGIVAGKSGEDADKYFIGYVLDIEDGNNIQAANAAYKRMLKFAVTTGKKLMLYTCYKDYKKYKSLIAKVTSENADNRLGWWEARYGKNIGIFNAGFPPHKGCCLHQYSENGKYPGVVGNVDVNRMTGIKPLGYFTSSAIYGLEETKKEKYSGEFPKKLPARGYFKKGDGYLTLRDPMWQEEIKKVQRVINWVAGSGLTIDGEYGNKTMNAVRDAQKILDVPDDGYFGSKTLSACKKFKK